ncbi:MAG: hypothetical protein FVQ85_14160 [Planctomycetes bacterium]|nr:hypothetical protein [Planctomycetota bacterium]
MSENSTLIKYLLLAFVILTGGMVSTADAVNWSVPGDFSNIQAAIDSPLVIDFDTITVIGNTVIPNVYSGNGFFNVDFKGKDITVQPGNVGGIYFPGSVIIDCQDQGRAFIFQSGESILARLQGFIIVDGNAADPISLWPQDPAVDASGYGGAIYVKNSSPIIKDCIITDCNADSGGGAIFCDENGNAQISFCDIGLDFSSFNAAGVGFYKNIDVNDINDVNQLDVNDLHQFGGGIYCRNSSPRIINCNIIWNISAGSGGGIACENSDAVIQDCNIWENDAWVNDDRIDQHGGGIYVKGGSPTILRNNIIRNDTRWSGGGIAVQDGNGVSITNCDIIDNHCWASAGGIYSQGNSSGDPNANADSNNPNLILDNCLIIHNWGYWSGGVSSNYGSFADIDDCTIAWNVASWSWLVGGLETFGGDANVANTIIVDNTGVQMASAGASASAMGMELGGLEMEIFGVNEGIDVSYSNIQMFDSEGFYDPTAVWPGEGNINKDPMFINPFRPYNFRLKSGTGEWNTSPCINAGDPFADYSQEPAPNGGRINMGAYAGTNKATSSNILRPVPADADADLKVNMVDLAILADNWDLEGANIKNKKADSDNNNIVDGRDLSILHKFWLWLQ